MREQTTSLSLSVVQRKLRWHDKVNTERRQMWTDWREHCRVFIVLTNCFPFLLQLHSLLTVRKSELCWMDPSVSSFLWSRIESQKLCRVSVPCKYQIRLIVLLKLKKNNSLSKIQNLKHSTVFLKSSWWQWMFSK